jgi:hypothetical protein
VVMPQPPGMGAPPMGLPMGAPPMGAQSPPNTTIDIARLQEMWKNTAPPQAIYPNWFKPPKRPNAQKVHETAIVRFDEMAEWRMAVRHDLEVLRGSVEGIFPDDTEDYYAGIIDEWASPALIFELNLAVSYLAELGRRFSKPYTDDKSAYESRKVELAAKWLNETEARQQGDGMGLDPATLEPKILLPYGFLAKRRVLNKAAEPWESPFRVDYIDPAQLVIQRGRAQDGIEKIYRVYSARAEDLAASYGDFAPSVLAKLKDLYGEIDDSTEFNDVVEYWDPWYRCVTVGGIELVPVTEHKYGEVPYSFAFSPLGEPRMTTLPEQSTGAAMNRETMRTNAPHKSVGFIRFMKKQHAQFEAIMKRNLYSLKLGNNPPVQRGRSAMASQQPAPDLIAKPGAQNEYMLGEEKIDPFPYANRMGYDQGVLLEAIERDMSKGMAPDSARGLFSQSNISGTANKMGLQAGEHLWKPWAREIDRYLERDTAKAFRLWQRLGHTVEYASSNRRPFVVPNDRPQKGEPGSFELTKECLEKVGPHVKVRSGNVNLTDPMVWNSIKMANEVGLPKQEAFDRLAEITYDPQMQQEWLEEQSLAIAMQNPEFMKIIGIPAMMASEMNEAQDDPERMALLQSLLQGWMQVVVQPAMMEQQLQMGQMGMQQQQMGMQQQQMQQQSMNAPTSAQSFQDTGQGPGSQSGKQGGPQGPTGPRGGGQG